MIKSEGDLSCTFDCLLDPQCLTPQQNGGAAEDKAVQEPNSLAENQRFPSERTDLMRNYFSSDYNSSLLLFPSAVQVLKAYSCGQLTLVN